MALTFKEKQELAALEKELANQPMASGGLTPQEEAEMAQLEAELAPKPEQISPYESFTNAVANTALMGYLPQIQAATEPIIQKGAEALFGNNIDEQLAQQGFKVQQNEPSYTQKRDVYAQRIAQSEAQNPKTALAGSLAGAIGGGGVISSGLGLLGVGATTPAMGIASKLKEAAKVGAVTGVLRNPGETEGQLNPLQLEERAKNAATDAVLGAGIQGLFSGAGKVGEVIKKAPETLSEYSYNKALKAAGAMKKDFKTAIFKNKVNQIGQEIIDSKIVQPGDTIADVAEKASSEVASVGNKIGKIYTKADNLSGGLNKEDIKSLIYDYANDASDRLRGTIGGEAASAKIQNVLDLITESDNLTFSELRKLRSSIDDQINFAKMSNDLPEYQKELNFLRNKIQEKVQQKIGTFNKPLANELKSLNKKFSNLSTIEDFAKTKLAGEEANAAFGLRERISGGTGATVGAGIGGAMGGGAGAAIGAAAGGALGAITTKAARQYGTPYVAITANKIARVLEQNPEALGKFSAPLLNAASKSPKDFVTTINMFLKEPEFKAQVGGN